MFKPTKVQFCTLLIHYTNIIFNTIQTPYTIQIILQKCWILEFLEIVILLNHSVTTGYSFSWQHFYYLSLVDQIMGFALKQLETLWQKAGHEQNFSPFSKMFFQRLVPYGVAVTGSFSKGLTLFHIIPTFEDPKEECFGNEVGKGENAGISIFCFYPCLFLPFPKQVLIFGSHFNCHLQMPSIQTSSEFCLAPPAGGSLMSI